TAVLRDDDEPHTRWERHRPVGERFEQMQAHRAAGAEKREKDIRARAERDLASAALRCSAVDVGGCEPAESSLGRLWQRGVRGKSLEPPKDLGVASEQRDDEEAEDGEEQRL